jgi:YHS domain-containing protein
VKILIVLILILVLYYMLRGLLSPRRGGKVNRERPSARKWVGGNELVKDPYCQTYIPMDTAFQAKIGGDNLFFCSEDCMNRYVEEKGGRS